MKHVRNNRVEEAAPSAGAILRLGNIRMRNCRRGALLAAVFSCGMAVSAASSVHAESLMDAIALAYQTNPQILTQRSILRNADEVYYRTQRACIGRDRSRADVSLGATSINDFDPATTCVVAHLRLERRSASPRTTIGFRSTDTSTADAQHHSADLFGRAVDRQHQGPGSRRHGRPRDTCAGSNQAVLLLIVVQRLRRGEPLGRRRRHRRTERRGADPPAGGSPDPIRGRRQHPHRRRPGPVAPCDLAQTLADHRPRLAGQRPGHLRQRRRPAAGDAGSKGSRRSPTCCPRTRRGGLRRRPRKTTRPCARPICRSASRPNSSPRPARPTGRRSPAPSSAAKRPTSSARPRTPTSPPASGPRSRSTLA